jgi:hypothetical protein
LRGDLVHGVVDLPEPQIGLGQRVTQGLRTRDRYQPLLVAAAEQNGDAHQFSPLSFRDGAQRQTRNLVLQSPDSGFALTRAPE